MALFTDHREHGTALVTIFFFVILSLGMIVSGTTSLQSSKKKEDVRIAVEVHAAHLANAGLVEATSWFKRQANQPVLAFEPILDTTVEPQIKDTIDPEIGIVREIPVSGNLWGRYEVWKQWDADPDPVRLAVRKRLQVQDMSLELGHTSPGLVWTIKCRGIIYRRRHPTKAPNEAPNVVLATHVAETELCQTMRVAPPGKAAVLTQRADTVTIGSGAMISSDDQSAAGVLYGADTGAATVGTTSSTASSTNLDLSIENVFGVTYDQLKRNADLVVTSIVDLPRMRGNLVVLESPADAEVVVDYANRLRGRGVLVVKTSLLTFTKFNMSDFRGLLYVTGAMAYDGPAWIRGTTIPVGGLSMPGNTESTTLSYSKVAVKALRKAIGYRRQRQGSFAQTGK